MKNLIMLAVLCAGLMLTQTAFAQFNMSRGQNAPAPAVQDVEVEYKDSDGSTKTRTERRRVEAKRDTWGNAAGNQYDLAIDGAFEGQTVAVLHLYTGFDFSLPKAALKEKGFSVYRWVGAAPSVKELEQGLDKACQLWIISDSKRHLSKAHIALIKQFFNSGRGVYIWGDNDPYYSDANAVAKALFGGEMQGNLPGTVTVSIRKGKKKAGLMPNHDITTGLEHLYEGVTIATLQPNDALEPLVYGSAGNLVTAVYEHNQRRAVLDGGFTRLYVNWDTAGTARYVKNAAAWLTNYERFGDDVVANQYRKSPSK